MGEPTGPLDWWTSTSSGSTGGEDEDHEQGVPGSETLANTDRNPYAQQVTP